MLNVSDFQQPDAYSRLPGDWLSAVSSPTANGLNRLILVFPMLTVKLSIVPIILLPRIVRLPHCFHVFFFFIQKLCQDSYRYPSCSLCCQRILATSFCACCLLLFFLTPFYPFEYYIRFLEDCLLHESDDIDANAGFLIVPPLLPSVMDWQVTCE